MAGDVGELATLPPTPPNLTRNGFALESELLLLLLLLPAPAADTRHSAPDKTDQEEEQEQEQQQQQEQQQEQEWNCSWCSPIVLSAYPLSSDNCRPQDGSQSMSNGTHYSHSLSHLSHLSVPCSASIWARSDSAADCG
ncbi:hypothetical protein AWZ03_000317 [Drosophila navojoa]|uniref:Uncharacterized protein n=1 Tax=Drosophila navojoa TaxID=7232 RepID=A0A484C1V9_DRONA|nr:hypothetical protein AWZ03_000317 [Drosophila navojoa]